MAWCGSVPHGIGWVFILCHGVEVFTSWYRVGVYFMLWCGSVYLMVQGACLFYAMVWKCLPHGIGWVFILCHGVEVFTSWYRVGVYFMPWCGSVYLMVYGGCLFYGLVCGHLLHCKCNMYGVDVYFMAW